jgi:hypothetical protein
MPSREHHEPDHHMTEARQFRPHKRRNSEQVSPSSNETSCQHHSKRRKRSHHDEPQFPRAFWDNLSSIHLTKHALNELDRRNTQVAATSRPQSGSRYHIYIHPRDTRLPLTKGHTILSVANFLRHYGPAHLRELRRFARVGGPDLSNARGVSKLLSLCLRR